VFTARYALSPYIKQIRFVFKGLIYEVRKRGKIGLNQALIYVHTFPPLSFPIFCPLLFNSVAKKNIYIYIYIYICILRKIIGVGTHAPSKLSLCYLAFSWRTERKLRDLKSIQMQLLLTTTTALRTSAVFTVSSNSSASFPQYQISLY
jgi:hypothetical protein